MATETTNTASERFHDRLHANHMYGLWELASQMTPAPQPKAIPFHWPWELLSDIVNEACVAVPVGDERRALQLFNPGLDGRWATTQTLLGAVQVLLPGETARAHRHAPTAIRFIMEGEGAYTAVDGERVYMKPGDLVLTPSWTWHDHGNETAERVVWFDGLDVPLVHSLDAMFFQMYDVPQVPLTRENNASQRLHGRAALRPSWVRERPLSSPLLIYAWDETAKALGSLRSQPADPCDGVILEYTNPETGGPVLPTMACHIQLLASGKSYAPHRHTSSSVYLVVRGEGLTVADGREFHWRRGDIIALPAWAEHQHANTSAGDDAVLFSISDRPVQEKLGLYREES
jgi:gentisate 1,2-dioxygenase